TKRFWFKSFERTLADAPELDVEAEVLDALVAFVHAEVADEAPEARARAFRHTLKHIKWVANKRGVKNVVLHSFTHLGADNAAPEMARDFLAELAERLERSGYRVTCTPFGYFCEWDMHVHGE